MVSPPGAAEVKSYKDGLETTWDVLETDGHLNSMRIVGRWAGRDGEMGKRYRTMGKNKVANMTLYDIMYMWLCGICRVL